MVWPTVRDQCVTELVAAFFVSGPDQGLIEWPIKALLKLHTLLLFSVAAPVSPLSIVLGCSTSIVR